MSSLPHSYLFVPGNRPERFSKAYAAGAGAVIIDLEDAVPAAEKIAARAALKAWLSPEQAVLVRINGADTEWFEGDLELCRLPGVAGIVLPKAEQVEQIVRAEMAGARAILPLIESAAGFWNMRELALAPGVQRLVFGSIDFQLDLGIDGEGEELLYFRSQLVLVSRLAGLQPPVDGVSTAIDDESALHADALRARRLGFGAKLCIHPRQIAQVHQAFRPSEAQLAWARRVLEAAEAAQGAAVAVDGAMVDRPVILKAREMLAQSQRLDN
ncbi:MAG: CoA ester lyase [Pseudomonadota bacterium]